MHIRSGVSITVGNFRPEAFARAHKTATANSCLSPADSFEAGTSPSPIIFIVSMKEFGHIEIESTKDFFRKFVEDQQLGQGLCSNSFFCVHL
jgi:hypothetical protein